MDPHSLHRDLLRDCIGPDLSESDALLWIVLLHTHEIRMKPGTAANENGNPILALPAVTQRHAAEVVAAVWSERHSEDDRRSSYGYWYHQYNTRTPYELLDDVPEHLRPRLFELRDALASDPRVAAVVAEE